MPVEAWWIIGIVVWLACGWLPTRIMKAYFIDEFGDDGWFWACQLYSMLLALVGPASLICVIVTRLTFGGKWGWRW